MLYFVRHGQTNDNINKILTGFSSTPLNETGISQAKQTALELADVKFDICFCSPLTRTRQTLEEILKFHKDLEVVYDDRLKERDYGEITGKPTNICTFRRWNANDKIPFQMETIPEFYNRIASFYNDIKINHNSKNILIVSHSGVGRMSHFYFNGKPADGDYSNFKIENAKVMEFDF